MTKSITAEIQHLILIFTDPSWVTDSLTRPRLVALR